jgi:hypothetical protein
MRWIAHKNRFHDPVIRQAQAVFDRPAVFGRQGSDNFRAVYPAVGCHLFSQCFTKAGNIRQIGLSVFMKMRKELTPAKSRFVDRLHPFAQITLL